MIDKISRTIEVVDSKLRTYELNLPALPANPAADNQAAIVILNVPLR